MKNGKDLEIIELKAVVDALRTENSRLARLLQERDEKSVELKTKVANQRKTITGLTKSLESAKIAENLEKSLNKVFEFYPAIKKLTGEMNLEKQSSFFKIDHEPNYKIGQVVNIDGDFLSITAIFAPLRGNDDRYLYSLSDAQGYECKILEELEIDGEVAISKMEKTTPKPVPWSDYADLVVALHEAGEEIKELKELASAKNAQPQNPRFKVGDRVDLGNGEPAKISEVVVYFTVEEEEWPNLIHYELTEEDLTPAEEA